MKYQIHLGDSLEVLKQMADSSVDSLVTDPPAGISLLGLNWDNDQGGRLAWIKWLRAIMEQCNRVMKPGAHGLVWAIPRTSHWTATALEEAGFEVKDVIVHIFGNGFPKNTAIDKALDRAKYTDTDLLFRVTAWIRARRDELGLTNKLLDEAAGVRGGACHWTASHEGQPNIPTQERWEGLEKVLGPPPDWMRDAIRPAHERGEAWVTRKKTGEYKREAGGIGPNFPANDRSITEPTSDHSKKWEGWGTALKPANEHWILVQRPISEHNLAANIRKHGAGGINIDASRIPVKDRIPSTSNLSFKGGGLIWDSSKRSKDSFYNQHPLGRYPANVILTRSNNDECPSKILNSQSERGIEVAKFFKNFRTEMPYLYCKKPNKNERGEGNLHPTVKPLRLMRYFCKMLTPPGGAVLDPFMGSGTTGVAALFEGFQFLGIEKEPSYFETSQKRLKGVKDE